MGDFFQPSQSKHRTSVVDPYAGMDERDVTRDVIYAHGQKPGNRPQFDYQPAGMNYQQAAGAGQSGAYAGRAEPYFGAGVNTLQRTAAGEYLDPTQSPTYARMEAANRAVGQDTYRDLIGEIAGRTARSGNYYSSARTAHEDDAARRVSTDIAKDLAQRAFGQYGAERGLQQGASMFGAQLGPQLAQQLFGQGSQLRGQDRQEAEMQLRAFLANQGVDQQGIDNMLAYLGITKPQVQGALVGPSEGSQLTANIGDIAGAAASIYGAGAGFARGGYVAPPAVLQMFEQNEQDPLTGEIGGWDTRDPTNTAPSSTESGPGMSAQGRGRLGAAGMGALRGGQMGAKFGPIGMLGGALLGGGWGYASQAAKDRALDQAAKDIVAQAGAFGPAGAADRAALDRMSAEDAARAEGAPSGLGGGDFGPAGAGEGAENYAAGGPVWAGPGKVQSGPPGVDQVPAKLTVGEFVSNPAATQQHLPQLQRWNAQGNAMMGNPMRSARPNLATMGALLRQRPAQAAPAMGDPRRGAGWGFAEGGLVDDMEPNVRAALQQRGLQGPELETVMVHVRRALQGA